MKHHQTRRKNRGDLKKRRLTRRQRGGAAVASAKEWFLAVDAFKEEKTIEGTYSFDYLKNESLTLPNITGNNVYDFLIEGQAIDGKEPTLVKFDLRMISVIIASILSNINTPATFDATIKQIMTSTDAQKDTVEFLNEVEVALQKASQKSSDVSVYDRKGQPLYIWFLSRNPASIPDESIPPITIHLSTAMQTAVNQLATAINPPAPPTNPPAAPAPTQQAPSVPEVK
jgi:hypothetical protein